MEEEYSARKVFMAFDDAFGLGFAFGLGLVGAELIAAFVIGIVIGIGWAIGS
jgi:hypothetical protein